ncbi:sugar porter family MFS transporter [Gynurincola endophyticus]|uniref:sugar porter family MFS transporter n=1 Tax=Gynurincola endophyticus TaxID=2479004 RepID=UPI000F8F335F|nr:sugar porter family MFS transporter [Gynurincola endophyticus]
MSQASHKSFLYKCTIVAAVGGFLFGYDTAVVSGAIGYMETYYSLDAAMKGWAASCALIGCMIGAMVAGVLSDSWGRKKVLQLAAFAFAISSIGILIPMNFSGFIVFRMIGGIGIGLASILAPLYISEIAPAESRGRLVSIYQLGIVIGILVIYFVNAGIASLNTVEWNIATGWRWMFGSGILPSILFIILLANVPESPRWLVQQHRSVEAKSILLKINDAVTVENEMNSIQSAIGEKQISLKELWKTGFRKALLIGVVLAILSQITGINVIMYYAPEIFKQTGADTESSLLQTIIVGAINFLMTLVAIRYVDRLGRKKLLLIGSLGMAVCLLIVGLGFHWNIGQAWIILLSILLYISFFAISLGPLTFVVVSEIFPNQVRGRAMSIAIFFLWLSTYIVSQTFPMLLESVGAAKTFWIYMILSAVAFVFVWKFIPETKGKSLEEIEKMWQ